MHRDQVEAKHHIRCIVIGYRTTYFRMRLTVPCCLRQIPTRTYLFEVVLNIDSGLFLSTTPNCCMESQNHKQQCLCCDNMYIVVSNSKENSYLTEMDLHMPAKVPKNNEM